MIQLQIHLVYCYIAQNLCIYNGLETIDFITFNINSILIYVIIPFGNNAIIHLLSNLIFIYTTTITLRCFV